MLRVVFLMFSSGLSADADLLVKESWSMRSPSKYANSTELTCVDKEYEISYGFTSHTEISKKGNRFFEKRSPLELNSFDTNAFEVSGPLTKKLSDAVSAYSSLDHISLNCGWRIDDEETEFLSITLVGRHKGDHIPYRDECAADDGIFFDETSRKYIIKDGNFYDMNKTKNLGRCVYGQEFFSLQLESE